MYHLPYGEAWLEFVLPPDMRGTVVESKKVKPLPLSLIHI